MSTGVQIVRLRFWIFVSKYLLRNLKLWMNRAQRRYCDDLHHNREMKVFDLPSNTLWFGNVHLYFITHLSLTYAKLDVIEGKNEIKTVQCKDKLTLFSGTLKSLRIVLAANIAFFSKLIESCKLNLRLWKVADANKMI